jgi:hypothetical protein
MENGDFSANYRADSQPRQRGRCTFVGFVGFDWPIRHRKWFSIVPEETLELNIYCLAKSEGPIGRTKAALELKHYPHLDF